IQFAEDFRKQQVIRGIAIAPSRRIAAVGELGGVIRLWDLELGKPFCYLKMAEMGLDRVNDAIMMAFSADGRKFVTAGRLWRPGDLGDYKVAIWEVSTGKKLLQLSRSGVRVRSVRLSPDGNILATYESTDWPVGGKVQLWDAQTGKSLHIITST